MLPLVNPNFENRWVDQVTNADYHADKTILGSSLAREMEKSSLAFLTTLNSPPKEQTPAQRLGYLIHFGILEYDKFCRCYTLAPDFGSTKEGKARKQDFIESLGQGQSYVTESEFEVIDGIRQSISRHKDAMALLTGGHAERTGYYCDPLTKIQCKIRPDYYIPDKQILVDLKTTTDCTFDVFARSMATYRYDFQMAMYSLGCQMIDGNRPEPFIIACEKTPPYEVAVYAIGKQTIEYGLKSYERVMTRLEKCLRTEQWPGYQTDLQVMDLPQWMFNKQKEFL